MQLRSSLPMQTSQLAINTAYSLDALPLLHSIFLGDEDASSEPENRCGDLYLWADTGKAAQKDATQRATQSKGDGETKSMPVDAGQYGDGRYLES